MTRNKEKWIDELINTKHQLQRVKPKSDLFLKIEARINDLDVEIIPMRRLRFMAAASLLLLAINIIGFNYHQSRQIDGDNLAVEDYYGTEVFFTDNNNIYSN